MGQNEKNKGRLSLCDRGQSFKTLPTLSKTLSTLQGERKKGIRKKTLINFIVCFILFLFVFCCFGNQKVYAKKKITKIKANISITLKANSAKPGRITLTNVPNKKGTVWYYYKNDPCVKSVDAYANYIDIYPGEWNGKTSLYALRKTKTTKKEVHYDKYFVNITVTGGKDGLKAVVEKHGIHESKDKEAITYPVKTKTANIGLGAGQKPQSYEKAMVELLSAMRNYAKNKKGSFNMITNGGYGLYMPSSKTAKSFFKAVDGVLVEDVYYGWDANYNKKTSSSDTKEILSALKNAKKHGIPAFALEYCSGDKAKKAVKKLKGKGIVPYAAKDMDLTKIKGLSASQINPKPINKLSDVKNYMILLDPGKFKSKKAYLKALRNTNYDMIFIDAYYNGKLLTKAEVNSLKKKRANGQKRLVCTYISIGEAEKYRNYWTKKWQKGNFRILSSLNDKWEENYKVKYWTKNWMKVLFGSNSGYLDRVLNSGFDGAYLDVIDAYEHFKK